MSRLSKEQREEIFEKIIKSNNDPAIIVENLQLLRTDGDNSDTLFDGMNTTISNHEKAHQELQVKFFETFMSGGANEENDIPKPTGSNEEIKDDEVIEDSYNDLLSD